MFLYKIKKLIFKILRIKQYRGHIDIYRENSFYGWLEELNNESTPQKILVRHGEKIIKTAKTGIYRDDLLREGINPKSGFIIHIPDNAIFTNLKFTSENGFELKINKEVRSKINQISKNGNKLIDKERKSKLTKNKSTTNSSGRLHDKLIIIKSLNSGVIEFITQIDNLEIQIMVDGLEVVKRTIVEKNTFQFINLGNLLCDGNQHKISIIADNSIILSNYMYRSRLLNIESTLHVLNKDSIIGVAFNNLNLKGYLKLELYLNSILHKVYIADQILDETDKAFKINLKELNLSSDDTLRLEISGEKIIFKDFYKNLNES